MSYYKYLIIAASAIPKTCLFIPSTTGSILFNKILENIFDTIGDNVIPLQLPQSLKSPFFQNNPSFPILRYYSCPQMLLKRLFNKTGSLSFSTLRISGNSPSSPGVLLFFYGFIAVFTSLKVISPI